MNIPDDLNYYIISFFKKPLYGMDFLIYKILKSISKKFNIIVKNYFKFIHKKFYSDDFTLEYYNKIENLNILCEFKFDYGQRGREMFCNRAFYECNFKVIKLLYQSEFDNLNIENIIKNKRVDILTYIIENNFKYNVENLVLCCKYGNLEIFKILSKNYYYLGDKYNLSRCFQYAVDSSNIDIFNLLKSENKYHKLKLSFNVIFDDENIEMIEFLKNQNIKIKITQFILDDLVVNNRVKSIMWLKDNHYNLTPSKYALCLNKSMRPLFTFSYENLYKYEIKNACIKNDILTLNKIINFDNFELDCSLASYLWLNKKNLILDYFKSKNVKITIPEKLNNYLKLSESRTNITDERN